MSTYTDLRPLEIEDDRPYHYFAYTDMLGGVKFTGIDKGMKWEVCAYSEDNDKMKLPRLVRQYYRTEEAAAVAMGLLTLFASGKTKQEVDGIKGPEL